VCKRTVIDGSLITLIERIFTDFKISCKVFKNLVGLFFTVIPTRSKKDLAGEVTSFKGFV